MYDFKMTIAYFDRLEAHNYFWKIKVHKIDILARIREKRLNVFDISQYPRVLCYILGYIMLNVVRMLWSQQISWAQDVDDSL